MLREILLFFGKYDLRKECWLAVAENHGNQYADKFVHIYDKINNGESIGNLYTTMAFLNEVDKVRDWCESKSFKNMIKNKFGRDNDECRKY